MRALVVDDSSSNGAILQKMLIRLGFEVTMCKNAFEALALMSTSNLDLVTINWNMPVINGLDLLRQIRAQPRYDPVKIVMVTIQSNQTGILHAVAAGADEYIMKPFTSEVVSGKLQLLGLCPVPCPQPAAGQSREAGTRFITD